MSNKGMITWALVAFAGLPITVRALNGLRELSSVGHLLLYWSTGYKLGYAGPGPYRPGYECGPRSSLAIMGSEDSLPQSLSVMGSPYLRLFQEARSAEECDKHIAHGPNHPI
jgi:hypothetical protein